ncbi:hypothetical protein B0H19DRAFT_1334985, partial [Mycena capillaripes]
TYAFCPAPHRKQLLRIFIRNFCEHLLLPDRAGSTRTSDKIRYDAVWEMYQFCFQTGTTRGLGIHVDCVVLSDKFQTLGTLFRAEH